MPALDPGSGIDGLAGLVQSAGHEPKAGFRLYYGPITRLADTLDEGTRAQFAADLADVARKFNVADDGSVLAPGEYLEAIGVRR